MKKFIEIMLIFTLIVAAVASMAMLLGVNMSEQQHAALAGFCLGSLILAAYRAILSEEI